MSMDHKAFAFDNDEFEKRLAWSLYNALTENNAAALVGFISANSLALRHPDEAVPLSKNWKADLDLEDVQLMADIALTKFYDPSANFGLGYEWTETEDALRALGLDAATILLGGVVGPEDNLFDPGRMGSYFQTPELVRANIASLLSTPTESYGSQQMTAAFEMLRRAQVARRGMYITF